MFVSLFHYQSCQPMKNTNIPKEHETKSDSIKQDSPISTKLPETNHNKHKVSEPCKIPTNENKNSKFKTWFKHNGTQSIIGFITLVTLLAYIWVSQQQINQTQQSLVWADSAIRQNRENINRNILESKNSDVLNRKSIEIADSSMRVSAKIAEIQEKFTKKELRAYITFQGYTANPDLSQTETPIEFKMKITNSGKTPAYKIYWFAKFFISESKLSIDYIKSMEMITPYSGMNNLGAGLDIDLDAKSDLIMNKETIEKINNGSMIFYSWGKFVYFDVFNTKHFTRFCTYYNTSTKTFSTYEKYNDGD
jgi:hypothetical protein